MSAKKSQVFTDEEREAMKSRAREMKGGKAAEGVDAILDKLAEMTDEDRVMGQKVHEIVTANGPELTPKLWYGMPAYAKDDKVVCFFQSAAKFKARYSTVGFNDPANLDDGGMWPVAFALKKLTGKEEKELAALVKKAVS